MPVYEYECPRCLNRIEISMSIKKYEESTAPKCVEPGCDGGVDMVHVISAPGLHFKGSGWTPKFH